MAVWGMAVWAWAPPAAKAETRIMAAAVARVGMASSWDEQFSTTVAAPARRPNDSDHQAEVLGRGQCNSPESLRAAFLTDQTGIGGFVRRGRSHWWQRHVVPGKRHGIGTLGELDLEHHHVL